MKIKILLKEKQVKTYRNKGKYKKTGKNKMVDIMINKSIYNELKKNIMRWRKK